MSKQKPDEAGASEGARRATGEGPASSTRAGGKGRWSARRKVSVVLELLRGADLESLSRRHGVTAATLSAWRDDFLASGEAGLKRREVQLEDEDTRRLKSVVAELATEKELLKEKIRHLEASGPLGWWRSKR
jgi:transposase-like protein